MSITYANGTITLTYTALPAQMTKVLLNAAEALYPSYRLYDSGKPRRPIPFASLTNAQRLEIINKHVRAVIVSAAEANRNKKAAEASHSDDQTFPEIAPK